MVLDQQHGDRIGTVVSYIHGFASCCAKTTQATVVPPLARSSTEISPPMIAARYSITFNPAPSEFFRLFENPTPSSETVRLMAEGLALNCTEMALAFPCSTSLSIASWAMR